MLSHGTTRKYNVDRCRCDLCKQAKSRSSQDRCACGQLKWRTSSACRDCLPPRRSNGDDGPIVPRSIDLDNQREALWTPPHMAPACVECSGSGYVRVRINNRESHWTKCASCVDHPGRVMTHQKWSETRAAQ